MNYMGKYGFYKKCVYSSSDGNSQNILARSLIKLTTRCGKHKQKRKTKNSHVLVGSLVLLFFCYLVKLSILVYFPGYSPSPTLGPILFFYRYLGMMNYAKSYPAISQVKCLSIMLNMPLALPNSHS